MSDNRVILQIDFDKGDVKGVTSEIEKSVTKSAQKSASIFTKEFDLGIAAGLKRVGGAALRATSLVGGLATALVGIQSIRAAQEQEDAINNLNNALRTSGDFSIAASNSFQSLASELQSITRFGDEAILNQIALAKSFGATNEQAEEIIKAATDLSAAFGIDLESATRNVAKTLGGYAGELGETIPQLKELTTAQLQAGAGVELLANRFRGAAQRDVATFSGALDQLGNSFGDTLESIGRLVTENQSVTKFLQLATKSFESFTASIDKFAEKNDIFDTATQGIIRFNQAIIDFALPPLELFGNVGNAVFQLVVGAIDDAIAAVAGLGGAIAKVFEFVGIENGLTTAIKNFAETSNQVAQEQSVKTREALSSVFDFPITDSLDKKNQDLRMFFEESRAIAEENRVINDEINLQQTEKARVQAATIKDIWKGTFEGLTSGVETASNSVEEANKKVADFSQKSGKQLQQGFGRAAGAAFAEFGAAVQKGNASLASFTDALFKQLAQSAVTLGTNFILEGTAYLFSANPTLQALGPSLIGSGAALAAFGGALGASAGGGSGASAGAGSPTTATGGEPAGTPVQEIPGDPEGLEQAREQSSVTVNIDRFVGEEEEARRVAEILSDAGAKNGTLLTDVRSFA